MKNNWLMLMLLTILLIFASAPLHAASMDQKPQPSNSKKPVKIEKKNGYIYEWYDGESKNKTPSELEIAKKLKLTTSVPSKPTQMQALSDYDNTDPIATGCATGAITAESATIKRIADQVSVGTIELRYSATCRTAWSKITINAIDVLKDGAAALYRNENGRYVLRAKTYASPGTSNYTNQYNDAGTTSYATAIIRDLRNNTFEAQTQPY